MQHPRDENAEKKRGHPAPSHKAKLQCNPADSRMVNVYKRLKTDGASHRLRSWVAELSLAITGEHGCNIREMESGHDMVRFTWRMNLLLLKSGKALSSFHRVKHGVA
jgi:hypothetical protein